MIAMLALAMPAFAMLPSGAVSRAGMRAVPTREFNLHTSYTANRVKNGRGHARYDVLGLHLTRPFLAWESGSGSRLEVSAGLFLAQSLTSTSDSEFGMPIEIRFRTVVFRSVGMCLQLEGGAGPAYFTRRFEEQSTHFNFADVLGVGFGWPLSDRLTLECGYRFRHVSNGDIRKPNRGVNGNGIVLGVIIQH